MKAAMAVRPMFMLAMLALANGAWAQPGSDAKVPPTPIVVSAQEWRAFPGEFAIRTRRGHYLTAISGGGRASDPTIVTAATEAGAWEKFRLAALTPGPTHDKRIQTASGHYLTAVGGGGRTSDVLHTDATQPRDWERFRILDLAAGGVAPTYFAIQALRGTYLTAMGEGGRYNDAIHSDATQIDAWEQLRIVKCGDLGSGYQYTILTASDLPLTADQGGGQAHGFALSHGGSSGDTPERSWARFRLIAQPDGSYAMQTANGRNYLTALGGGGQVQRDVPCRTGLSGTCLADVTAIFHTDATRVQAWERFRVVDQGNCKYTIQTSSGFYFGLHQVTPGNMLFTTRRSEISENEKFQLVMHGLASPAGLK